MNNIKNYLFDILFWITSYYLITFKNKTKIYELAVISLIFSHFIILIERYINGNEIKWPVFCEIIAIIIGIIFIYEGNLNNNIFLVLLGLIMIIGHIKKINKPHLPYYF